MTDLLLATTHHLAVFTLVGLLAAELALLRVGIAGTALARLGGIDAAYGAVAGAVIVAGFARVFFGDAGAGFYFANPVFWTKIGAFVLVGLLSIAPTIAILGWRRAAKADAAFAPPQAAVRGARRFLLAEAAVLVLIPGLAAAMARGYGL